MAIHAYIAQSQPMRAWDEPFIDLFPGEEFGLTVKSIKIFNQKFHIRKGNL